MPARLLHVVAVALAASFGGAGLSASRAEEPVPTLARRIFEHNREAVVKITGVAHIRLRAVGRADLNMPERDDKVRADGTLVDAAGLVVLSLSAIDPSRLVDGREANSPSGPIRVDASATLKELEIILGDGTEIPAVLVFKDEDLDLAFVRPKPDAAEARGLAFAPIDLAEWGEARTADYTVSVSRLDELFGNASSLVPGQVTAVIERPRAFYLATNVARGCPMFTLDGKLLGIGIVRHRKTESGAAMGNAIVPAAEVRKLVEQIPEASAPEAVSAPAP